MIDYRPTQRVVTQPLCATTMMLSGLASNGEKEKSLKYVEELMERGSTVNKEEDYAEVNDCFSRALEIRL